MANLKKWLLILGAANLAILLGRTVLSYFLVTVGPFGIEEPNEAKFFYFLTGNSIFHEPFVYVLSAGLPVFLSTDIFILLIVLLTKKSPEIDSETPQALFRWAAVFAVIGFFAVPMLAQDFWLSMGWGKMVVAGLNPYYIGIRQDYMQGLPLDTQHPLKMAYGPLWALISTVVVIISGGNAVIGGILFKLLLIGAWLGSLYLVWQLLRPHSLAAQCIGLVIFGWLPLSVIETAAEGHYDILMVFFMLLWLYKLEKGQILPATLALAASILINYATFPLLLVELLYLYGAENKPFSRFIVVFFKHYSHSFVIAGLFAAGVLAFFFRSFGFFAAASAMNKWEFFTPKSAIVDSFSQWHIPYISYVAVILQFVPFIIFWGSALYCARRFYLFPSTDRFRRVVLAVMTAILFSLPGNVSTWFLLWVIPLAALLPRSLLSRWNLGVALVFPLAVITLQFATLPPQILFNATGVVIYALAAIFLVLTQIILLKTRPIRL